MTLTEFRSWAEFYDVEPWGDYRADVRAGVVATVIARMLGAKGSRAAPIDFMPIVRAQLARARARTGDASAELRAAIMAGFKGRVRHVKLSRRGARHG